MRQVGVAQHGCGDGVIDRWTVNVTAVVRLLDNRDAVFSSDTGIWLLRHGRGRRRRPDVLEPAVRAESAHLASSTPDSGSVAQLVEPFETRGEERGLPRVEPIRTQVDVLGGQALEFRGCQVLQGPRYFPHFSAAAPLPDARTIAVWRESRQSRGSRCQPAA